MGDLYLIGRIGDTWIGMPAEQVEAVVPLIDVVPVPHAPMAVRGMVAIRSRLLTLVDSAAVAQCHSASPSTLMVIVSIDGHGYGLTIDEVDDVVSFDARQQIPATLSNGWRQLSSHMGEYGGRVILIVEPSRIIEEVQTVLAAAA